MTPTLRNARWYADVRAEALDADVAAAQIEAMDRTVTDAIDQLVSRGALSAQDATAVRWQLGMEDAPPHVDEPVRRFIVASWQLNDGAAQLDPFEQYAQGLEQELARVSMDYARQLNPTPRKDYEDPVTEPRPRGAGVMLALAILVGLVAFGSRRRAR